MLIQGRAAQRGVTNEYASANSSEQTLASQEEAGLFIIPPVRLTNPLFTDTEQRQDTLQ